jgi:hypothetical protein
MLVTIQELNRYFIDVWQGCESKLPDLGPRYTPQTQSHNEKRLLQFLEQADQAFSHPPRSREAARERQIRLGAAFRSLAQEALGFTAEQLDPLPSQAFSDASEEFVRMAREFDPKLSAEDIYQAGRNAWTANGLQWLMSVPVQISPSIFAYSLLYPYTDNYLDDPTITLENKRVFNERFRRRLAGESFWPLNIQERIIFDLIAMIEDQYSRADHPAVFESLLAIHHAQSQSLKLLRSAAQEVDVLGLSFEKGGTSVLADGYLVSGSLDETQRQYTYGHGVLAQLLDDMEDIELDHQDGRLTLYSQGAGHGSLDALANRTFHFGQKVLMGLDFFDIEEPVRELIRRGANLLVLDAISRMKDHYTAAYLHELEAYSPFRFAFLKAQRVDFLRRHGSMARMMETALTFPGIPSHV